MALNLVSFWAAKPRLSLGISCVLTLCGGGALAQESAQPAGSSLVVPAPPPLPPPAPIALAPVPPPVPQRVSIETPLPGGQAKYGFLISATFGIKPLATSSGLAGAEINVNSALQGGLALGFKAGRAMFSVGADITSIDQRNSVSGMYERTTSFLIAPALQIALVRSRDQRIELVGSLRAGAGTTTSNDLTDTSPRPVLTMYEVAPLVRWWAHKQFAIQGLAGYSGNYVILRSTTTTASLGVHSAVASIGTLGVF